MSKYTKRDLYDMYDEHINEVCDQVKIGNLCYAPSQVLKGTDPTAYRVGFHDWLDAEIQAKNISVDAYEYEE